MMETFEGQLRRTLQRQEPPVGFAERVLARAQGPKRRSHWRMWAGAAIAAMLVAAPLIYQHQQQRRAEEAREQALTALRITAEKLNVVRDKIQRGKIQETTGESR